MAAGSVELGDAVGRFAGPSIEVLRQAAPHAIRVQVGPAQRPHDFPAVKSRDTLDFPAIPSLNKALVMELARCEYIQRRENVIAVGNSGTGKTHIALGLGLAACQRGMRWVSPPLPPWSTS